MHKSLNTVLQILICVLLPLLPASLLAQEPTGSLEEFWIFTVKSGHQGEFEAAFKDQGALRNKHGDPRHWDVYVPATGDDLNRYALRSCCFAWADQDSYTAWTMQNAPVMEQWYSKVNPHVENAAHYFHEMDLANSHWPENLTSPAMVGVTEFSIAPGKVNQFHAARAELSQIAINQGWAAGGRHWVWTDRIGGEPSADLVVPFDNYASMTPGEQSIAGFLTEKLGAEGAAALMEKITSSVSSSSYTIWVHRPDLSSSKD